MTDIDKSLVKAGDRVKVEVVFAYRKPWTIEGEVEEPDGAPVIGQHPLNHNAVHVIEHTPVWSEPDGWHYWKWLAVSGLHGDVAYFYALTGDPGTVREWFMLNDGQRWESSLIVARFGRAPFVWSEAEGPRVKPALSEPAAAGDGGCGTFSPDGVLQCTEPCGHAGWHVACGLSGNVLESWPAPPVPAAAWDERCEAVHSSGWRCTRPAFHSGLLHRCGRDGVTW